MYTEMHNYMYAVKTFQHGCNLLRYDPFKIGLTKNKRKKMNVNINKDAFNVLIGVKAYIYVYKISRTYLQCFYIKYKKYYKSIPHVTLK